MYGARRTVHGVRGGPEKLYRCMLCAGCTGLRSELSYRSACCIFVCSDLVIRSHEPAAGRPPTPRTELNSSTRTPRHSSRELLCRPSRTRTCQAANTAVAAAAAFTLAAAAATTAAAAATP